MKQYLLTILLVLIIMSITYYSHCNLTDTSILEGIIAKQEKVIKSLTTRNYELEEYTTSLEETLRESRVRRLTVTAYSPREVETDSDPFITASMQPVREGGVAVSRDLFYAGWVFGRKIYIEGYGIFVITDLMHSRKKEQIDIFMFNTKKALKFGKKKIRIALLD